MGCALILSDSSADAYYSKAISVLACHHDIPLSLMHNSSFIGLYWTC